MFRLYDTRTRQVETIRPARGGLLRMYSCGPAAYRYAHVGNLRAYLLADLIRRNAEHRHHLAVLTCQNITDVGDLADEEAGEDKVLAEARAEGRTALELARFYEDAFRADCSALNLRPAEHSPRASEWTGLMIEMIAGLIEAGHAYPTPDGSVYFDARSFPSYGELSGNRLAELRAGAARGAGEAGRGGGAGKRFHADWGLWKSAPADRELTWPAPWGTGFPVWHTECSALSLHDLGDVIDIHTGGIDLRFPHHEDERAQSDSVTGHEVVRHWVHGEHLLFDGRKMAKSAQNVVLVADLADRGLDPLALRLAFLEQGQAERGGPDAAPVARAGGGVGLLAKQAGARPGGRADRRGVRRRPGHSGGAAIAAPAREGPGCPAGIEVRVVRPRRPAPRSRPGPRSRPMS